VVGASANPGKDSNAIPRLLKDAGFRVIPVNPSADEILGERAYQTFADTEPVEIVDVFRPAEEAPDLARQAVEIGARRSGCRWVSAPTRPGGSPRTPASTTSRTTAWARRPVATASASSFGLQASATGVVCNYAHGAGGCQAYGTQSRDDP
jgi:CoA binding domain